MVSTASRQQQVPHRVREAPAIRAMSTTRVPAPLDASPTVRRQILRNPRWLSRKGFRPGWSMGFGACPRTSLNVIVSRRS
jgi:hypothetical protein